MYDIVFLSYHEVNADKHWDLLKQYSPRAMRVDGIDGIVAAHQAAARICTTRYFWVVDADNIVDADFYFDFSWKRRDAHEQVTVWRARNNVNGLEYGYGGIKLLPRRAVLNVASSVTDFTTSISDSFHIMDQVASTTYINSSPFEAWKSGFRECAKLASSVIKNGNTDETATRLDAWMNDAADVRYADYVLSGAKKGATYGNIHKNDPPALARINNWDWLRDRFYTNS
jgi:hypothetical protein